jgi:hypothetical protein
VLRKARITPNMQLANPIWKENCLHQPASDTARLCATWHGVLSLVNCVAEENDKPGYLLEQTNKFHCLVELASQTQFSGDIRVSHNSPHKCEVTLSYIGNDEQHHQS